MAARGVTSAARYLGPLCKRGHDAGGVIEWLLGLDEEDT